MRIEPCSVICAGKGPWLPGRGRLRLIHNEDNRMTPCQAYQKALNQTKAEVLVMIHEDVTIRDPHWLAMIHDLFVPIFDTGDPREPNPIVAAGLGGGTSLGRPDLYRKPFNIWNLARGGYASNQSDAEVHGERFTGVKRVAVLDAFVMAVRVEWLRRRGGWPVDNLTFHCLDLWLACEVARDDKEIWMYGADCTHHGGGVSVTDKYKDAGWLQGGTLSEDHLAPHRWLANVYRDVLPIEVKR
jgi:hypothetical protein